MTFYIIIYVNTLHQIFLPNDLQDYRKEYIKELIDDIHLKLRVFSTITCSIKKTSNIIAPVTYSGT